MAESNISVQVSGLDIIKNTLTNFESSLEFTDDCSEDYKKGFTDCLNGIIKAFEMNDNLKNSQK